MPIRGGHYINTYFTTDISGVKKELQFLRHLTKQIADLLDCRIDAVLDDMAHMALCDLPEHEPTTTDDFIKSTERICKEACEALTRWVTFSFLNCNTDAVYMAICDLPEYEPTNTEDVVKST